MPELKGCPIPTEDADQIARALRDRMLLNGIGADSIQFLLSGSKLRGDTLWIPAVMQERDLWQESGQLQDLEDWWNYDSGDRKYKLVLMPAGVSPSVTD